MKNAIKKIMCGAIISAMVLAIEYALFCGLGVL